MNKQLSKIKLFLIAAMVMAMAFLAGCGEDEGNQPITEGTFTYGDTSYELNAKAGTITAGDVTYRFSTEGDQKNYKINVTFPDGRTFVKKMEEGYGGIGGSENPSAGEMNVLNNLFDIAEKTLEPDKKQKTEGLGGKIACWFFAALFLGLGIYTVGHPDDIWQRSVGWEFKDAEPSEKALELYTFYGVGEIIIAIALVVISFII